MCNEIEVCIKAERETNCGGKKRGEIEGICAEHVAVGSQP